jgi:hypothetical protein
MTNYQEEGIKTTGKTKETPSCQSRLAHRLIHSSRIPKQKQE